MDDGPSWLMVATTVALDLGLAAMVGSLASCFWLRDSLSAWGDDFAQRSRSTLLVATGFTAVALVALLCVQTAAMADVQLVAIGPELGPVLAATQVGHAWLMAAPCLLVVVIAAVVGLRRDSLPMTWVAAAGSVAFICCRAAASHAAIHGPISIAVVVEAVHLLGISLWIGMLLVAAALMAANTVDRSASARTDAAAWIKRLSASATLVLVGVVLTGVFNAWRGLGSPGELATTHWGRILVLKLVLVIGAVALGGFNRMVVMPKLLPALAWADTSAAASLSRFVRVIRIEAVLLVAALGVAAVLAASAPGGIG